MSRLDAWHLLNVIFRLYGVIANCYDLCNLYREKKVLQLERWLDKDREIADFYRKPQRYEYGTDVHIELSEETFEELHEFIIEQNDFALAMDLVQPKIYLNHLIKTMKKVEVHHGMKFDSLGFMHALHDFRTEVYKWAAVYSSRINSSIDKEMARRKTMTYALLCDDKNCEMILQEETGHYPMAEENAFDLAGFFVHDYDAGRITLIYEHLASLNDEKGAGYVATMASVVAIAWENNLLCEAYGNTLRAVFDHFGIAEKIENYKPARLRRSSYKGNLPLARVQALNFFQSLEGMPAGQ